MYHKKTYHLPRVDMLPLIDCVFQLIIFFLMSYNSDPKLDDILKLPDAYKSVRQDDEKLQIYILQAVLNDDASIKEDSTGLIAFAPKEPKKGDPDAMEERYVLLDSVPGRLIRERKRLVKEKIDRENYSRANAKPPRELLTQAETDAMVNKVPLMIKADKHTFYGRILQVVAKARTVGISQFAIITTSNSSQEFIDGAKHRPIRTGTK